MNAYLVFDNIFGIYNPLKYYFIHLNCLTGKYKDANVSIQGTPKILKRVKSNLRLFHCLFARFKALRGLN